MIRLKNWYYASAIALLLISCDQAPESDMGVKVQFLRTDQGEKLTSGNVVMLHMKFTTENGGVITSTLGSDPMPLRYEEDSINQNGEFASVLELLSVGDSVYFEINAGDMYSKTLRRPLPDSIAETSKMKFNLGVVN